MRKIIVTTLTALALFALASGDALASGTSKASTESACNATMTAAKLTASKEAPSVDAKAGCPYSKGASGCAQLTSEEHARLCKGDGKCEFTTISIKGMTCGGCEQSVSAALTEVPGVLKVVGVSYEEGVAEVCFDPNKTTGEALITAVANKGYQAKIVPAVAKSSDSKGCSKLTGAKLTCSKLTCAMSGCYKAGKTKIEDKAEGTQ